ncbi:MAG: glycosyltransferase [Gammaproteobacteria bacterium]|jgi:glycosyltransferase involved in cell wall biosynthesis
MQKKIAIFGIDNFSKKNILQINCLNKHDISADVFTVDCLGDSRKNLPFGNNLFSLKKGLLRRIVQIYTYLRKNHSQLNHAEIYVRGRFALFYLFLSKLFKLKVIVVERGDLLYFDRFSFLTKISMWLLYKFSNMVWYREFYMKDYFDRWGIKHVFFLPNCIVKKNCQSDRKRDIDFLWVNRLIPERKSGWFVNVLSGQDFSKTNNAMLGLLENAKGDHSSEEEEFAKNNSPENLQVFGYIDPEQFYLRAKYFVLPSDIVYLNNALLEAMSYGVVPIISRVSGSDLIVDDGVSGFVADHSEAAFHDAMTKAFEIDQHEYVEMSRQVLKKVESDFSYDRWSEKLIGLYDSV